MANWRGALASYASNIDPLAAELFETTLGVPQRRDNVLSGLSIGEIGAVYEALLALSDPHSRKQHGQFFTPDDIAAFMADHHRKFEPGVWLDPCCGVGNLSFHLARAMPDPAAFVKHSLVLIDRDRTALESAAILLTAHFAQGDAASTLAALLQRSQVRDFLSKREPLPVHDYVIVNPPYAAAPARASFATGSSRELYAYFIERACRSASGFISITPASFLGGRKYAALRELLNGRQGGSAYVFDNVPDTCFRGFKYGSSNSSKTNFVRATVLVSSPNESSWNVTPILRWASRSRARMLRHAKAYLRPLHRTASGEWMKIMPGTEQVWDTLSRAASTLGDVISDVPTEFRLEVASTPRYYLSASTQPLARASKHVLSFADAEARDHAYLLLNSSLPYWWWRTIDGGVTLRKSDLLALPYVEFPADPVLVRLLLESDVCDVTVKLNSGRLNENVKRPANLVAKLDRHILGQTSFDFGEVYSADLFADVATNEDEDDAA